MLSPFLFFDNIAGLTQHYNQNQPSKIVYLDKVQMACNFLGNKINGPHESYINYSPNLANGCNSKEKIKLTVNSTAQKKTVNSEKMG